MATIRGQAEKRAELILGLLIQSALVRAMLVGLRVAGLMTFAPFLGSTSICVRFKAQLTLAFTVLLFPVCAPKVHSMTVSGWLATVLSEVFLGLLMGLAVQFVFDGAAIAGQIMGIQMGLSLVTVLDPQTQVDTTVLSVFNQTIVLLIFLQLNVHHWMLRALVDSYRLVPIGSFIASPAILQELLHVAGSMWIIGIQIAAPILLATLLTDLALSFLSKASPQLPILFMGISVKLLLGLAILVAALGFWPSYFQSHFAAMLWAIEHWLRMPR